MKIPSKFKSRLRFWLLGSRMYERVENELSGRGGDTARLTALSLDVTAIGHRLAHYDEVLGEPVAGRSNLKEMMSRFDAELDRSSVTTARVSALTKDVQAIGHRLASLDELAVANKAEIEALRSALAELEAKYRAASEKVQAFEEASKTMREAPVDPTPG